MGSETSLRRVLNVPLLTLYGVGTMVGGGFYALTGKVVGMAGMQAPLSILLAGLVALVSAFSFAELASRFPYSAGEAQYVKEAFRSRSLSVLVGWLVIATGVVSAAALANAIVMFLQDRVALNETLGIAAVVLAFGLVAAWGVGQSVFLAVLITFIEVGGLLFILFAARDGFGDLPARWEEMLVPASAGAWTGILAGGFLVFYAFIGFEDMVNMAEEVKEPRRTMPRSIILALLLTLLLYVSVLVAALLTVPANELAESRTPMATIVRPYGEDAVVALSIVSVLAGVNGALIQVIMASRVAYGMSNRGLGPRWLARVNPRTRTPVRATILVTTIVLVLALWFPLVTLAQITSTIILVVFALVNLALWWIKGRDPDPEGEGPRYWRALPLLGFVMCLAIVAYRLFGA